MNSRTAPGVIAAMSILLSGPAVVVECFSWNHRPLLAWISDNSPLSTLFRFCWYTAVLGDRIYLFVAGVLNVVLLVRKESPVWLKILVWAFFVVAVLGALQVGNNLRYERD